MIPVGSANDYAHSLGLDSDWWLRPDNAIAVRPVDVGLVRSGSRSRHFINGLGLGFNGAVTLESRKIKRLQGLALYGLALLRALCFDFTHPRMSIRLDGDVARSARPWRSSLLLPREGNFVIAPDAVLDDGWFDYVHAGPLSRLDLLGFVPGLIVGRLPKTHAKVRFGRCRSVALSSETALTVHVDGEFFARPEDDLPGIDGGIVAAPPARVFPLCAIGRGFWLVIVVG